MWEIIIILTGVINVSVTMFIISSYKVSLRKYLLFLGILTAFAYILYPQYEFLSTALIFIAITIFNFINTHKKGQSFVVSSLCVLSAFIMDGILSNIGVGILKMDMNIFMQDKWNILLYLVTCICLQLLILYTIRKVIENRYNFFNMKMPKVQYGLIVLLLVSSVGIIIYNANVGKMNGLSNEVLWRINCILLAYGAVIIGILLFLIHSGQIEQKRQLERQELEHNKLELKELKVYTKELEQMYEEMRGIKHDFNNILTGMAIMITEKNYDDLEQYYLNILMPLANQLKQNYYKLGNLHNMKIAELKGLLAIKLIEYNQKGIDFVVELDDSIDKSPMEIVKFCRIVGILVDNAIEEAECCEEPYVRCAFIKDDNKVIFIVKNKCRKKDSSVGNIMEKGFSTKGKNRGFGLYNLNKMIENNEQVSIIMENEEDEFQVTMVFEY